MCKLGCVWQRNGLDRTQKLKNILSKIKINPNIFIFCIILIIFYYYLNIKNYYKTNFFIFLYKNIIIIFSTLFKSATVLINFGFFKPHAKTATWQWLVFTVEWANISICGRLCQNCGSSPGTKSPDDCRFNTWPFLSYLHVHYVSCCPARQLHGRLWIGIPSWIFYIKISKREKFAILVHFILFYIYPNVCFKQNYYKVLQLRVHLKKMTI